MSNLAIEQQHELVEKTENAFKNVRVSVLQAASYLHECKVTNAWESKYTSFGEFVEDGCGLSQGFAAKLTKAYEYWVVQVGMKKQELVDIDSEKLYLAINLPGDDELKLEKARTLSRKEIKAELASSNEEECQHLSLVQICTHCHQRV